MCSTLFYNKYVSLYPKHVGEAVVKQWDEDKKSNVVGLYRKVFRGGFHAGWTGEAALFLDLLDLLNVY